MENKGIHGVAGKNKKNTDKNAKKAEAGMKNIWSNRAGYDEIVSDVLGSYVGMGEMGDYPVQDADDL
ncbi:MAG: hypothetical protein FWF08_08555 [Oscillospiraceae bacterium]|nr:hypothetical protein [Oscillospiraceae bacterium]